MVTVEFKPKPTPTAAFRKLVDENAKRSREREPRYGACASMCSFPWADDRILLDEIHDSGAAFDTQLQSPYFAAFDKTSADWS